jgi:hypothetical protein
VPLTLLMLMALTASADACLKLPATSKWEGRWSDVFGYSGTWWSEVTTAETSPGVWHSEGEGEVTEPAGDSPGHVNTTLECTGPTTDSIASNWIDGLGDNVNLAGTLSIAPKTALESGTWGGLSGVVGPDEGTWNGEFHPLTESEGIVPGTVEVASSSGTLINTLETKEATELPLLPSGEDVAPVGGVSFTASLPVGATVKVRLTLPPGSHPTSLLKLSGGKYVEVPASIVGETIEYEITDGGAFDEDHTANGEVIDPVVPVSSGVQVRSGALPTATRRSAYSVQLTASGGSPAYRWKKVGKLPKGLKLTKDGVLEGTPSVKLEPATYSIGVQVSDSEKPKQSGSATLMLTIH